MSRILARSAIRRALTRSGTNYWVAVGASRAAVPWGYRRGRAEPPERMPTALAVVYLGLALLLGLAVAAVVVGIVWSLVS